MEAKKTTSYNKLSNEALRESIESLIDRVSMLEERVKELEDDAKHQKQLTQWATRTR